MFFKESSGLALRLTTKTYWLRQSLTRLTFYKYRELCGTFSLLWPEWLKLNVNVGSQDTPHTQSSTQADAVMVGHFLHGNKQHKVSHLMPFVQEDTDDNKLP